MTDEEEKKMATTNLGTLEMTRHINAPPERVFEAWTKADHMKNWWGPKGFKMPYCKIDLRIGGTVHYCMRSPEGRDYWGKGTYLEIVEPGRLVITDTFSDEEGNMTSPTQHGLSKEWPSESQIIGIFDDEDGKTKLTLRHVGIPQSGKEREMCEEGWSQTLDRLTEYVETQK